MIIDVSKPTHLSPRAAEQVAKQERVVRAAQERIHAIVDHDRKHGDEEDPAMTKRLQSYRTRQGKRQTRYLLTGQRKAGGKSNLLKAFEFIYERCQTSHFSNFAGTPIRIADIARHIGKSDRQTYRALTHERA